MHKPWKMSPAKSGPKRDATRARSPIRQACGRRLTLAVFRKWQMARQRLPGDRDEAGSKSFVEGQLVAEPVAARYLEDQLVAEEADERLNRARPLVKPEG